MKKKPLIEVERVEKHCKALLEVYGISKGQVVVMMADNTKHTLGVGDRLAIRWVEVEDE